MSVEAMSWAMRADLTGSLSAEHRLVLTALADYADPAGANAWPSVPTLAHRLGTSDRSIQRALARLRKVGLIAPGNQALVQHLPKTRRPTVWVLRVGSRAAAPVIEDEPLPLPDEAPEPAPNVVPLTPRPGVTPVSPGDSSVTPNRGDTCGTGGVTAVSPKPRTNPPRPPKPPTTTTQRRDGVRPDGTCRCCDRRHAPGPLCPTEPRSDPDTIAAIRAANRKDQQP